MTWERVRAVALSVVRELPRVRRSVLKRVQGKLPALGATVTGAGAGESDADVEVYQHYGMASSPPEGTQVLVAGVGHEAGDPVVLGEIDHAHRPELEDGEVCLYAKGDARVLLMPDGSVSITGTSIALNGPGKAVARVGDGLRIVGSVTTGDGATYPVTFSEAEISTGSSSVSAG